MDKNNKHYNLIIDKIKAHCKYSEVEALLDSIARDAYEHSQVIINAITSEEVIDAYLDKVVAASIITVPKKMNFKKSVKNDVLSKIDLNPSQQDFTPLKEDFEISEAKKSYCTPKERKIVDNTETEVNTEVIPEETHSEIQEVDKSLVDKMINGVSSNNSIEVEENLIENTTVSETFETLVEQSEDTYNNEIESVNEELFEESAIEDNEDLIIDFTDNFVEDDTSSETEVHLEEDEVTLTEDFVEEEHLEEDEVTLTEDFVEEEHLEEGEVTLTEDFVEEEIADNDLEVLAEDTDINELVLNTEELDIETNEESQDLENSEIILNPDYSCFNFAPTSMHVDINDINECIEQLQKEYKNIDINLLKNLKYNKNYSITEIAKELNLSISEVLETLDALGQLIEE